jgi:hypothetical protein
MKDCILESIGFKIDLEEIVRNIKRLRAWNKEQREIRLEEAEIKIPEKNAGVLGLVLDLCYDRKFCKDAGINYSEIQADDSRLIKTAIMYYLLNLEN